MMCLRKVIDMEQPNLRFKTDDGSKKGEVALAIPPRTMPRGYSVSFSHPCQGKGRGSL